MAPHEQQQISQDDGKLKTSGNLRSIGPDDNSGGSAQQQLSTNDRQQTPTTHIRALQFNVWLDATKVKGGLELTASTILNSQADIVSLNEVKNFWGQDFIGNLKTELEKQSPSKTQWYGNFPGNPRKLSLHADTAIISKYPIVDERVVYRTLENSIVRSLIQISTTSTIAVYSVHLEYRSYSCYLPRGYNSQSPHFPGWNPITKTKDAEEESASSSRTVSYYLKALGSAIYGLVTHCDEHCGSEDLLPVTDIDAIHQDNIGSGRPDAINQILLDAETHNYPILIMGDFNEPSALDWTLETKDTADHNGVVYEWETTKRLLNAGYIDSYRQLYSNPITHPGYTWPAAAKGRLTDNDQQKQTLPVENTGWVKNADERDRIDFIFYKNPSPSERQKTDNVAGTSLQEIQSLKPVDAWLVGTPIMVVGDQLVNESIGSAYVSSDNKNHQSQQSLRGGDDEKNESLDDGEMSMSTPSNSLWKSKPSQDKCSLAPGSSWPSDHRAVITVFKLEQ